MWKILGIEPTDDMDEIKSAYAKLVLKYDPEAYPEEFRMISEAYKNACRYAARRNRTPAVRRIPRNSEFARKYSDYDNVTVMINETGVKTQLAKIAANKALSDYYAESSQNALSPEERVIRGMKSILKDSSERNNISSWRKIFSSDEFKSVIFLKNFRRNAGQMFAKEPLLPETAAYIAGNFKKGSKAVSDSGSMFGTVWISGSGIKYRDARKGRYISDVSPETSKKTILKRIFAGLLAVIFIIQILLMIGIIKR